MSRQEDIALTAVRKSTLRSLKEKKASRLAQIKRDYEAAVREVEIQYDEDPERLKAKYAAADYAKSEKARKRAEAKIAREKSAIEIAYSNIFEHPRSSMNSSTAVAYPSFSFA